MAVMGSFEHIIYCDPEYSAVIGDINGTRLEPVGLFGDTFSPLKF